MRWLRPEIKGKDVVVWAAALTSLLFVALICVFIVTGHPDLADWLFDYGWKVYLCVLPLSLALVLIYRRRHNIDAQDSRTSYVARWGTALFVTLLAILIIQFYASG